MRACLSREITGALGRIRGIVSETGAVLSAAATVAREAGIPVVSGARGAMKSIKDGDLVRVDGFRGRVDIVSTP